MAFPRSVKGVNNERDFPMSFTCHGAWNKLFHRWNFLPFCIVKSHFLVLSSQMVATGEPPTSEFWPKVVCCFGIQCTQHEMLHMLHGTLNFLVLGSSHALCSISFCQAFYLNSGNRFTILYPFIYLVHEASTYFGMTESSLLLLKVNSVKIKFASHIPVMCSGDTEGQKHMTTGTKYIL